MKNNVINPFTVTFGSNGRVEIIGKKEESWNKNSAVILAQGDHITWLWHSELNFCKNPLTTYVPDGSGKAMMIFEYSFRGPLRNPQKLLKSVRNKLMGAIHLEQVRLEKEWHEESGGNLPTDHCV